MVFGKFVKKIGKALSPKKVRKAASKTVPKVLTGGAFLGAGIAAEKLAAMNEEVPMMTAEAPDDSNLIDQSYTLIKVEDITNGESPSTVTPTMITTIVMSIMIMCGMVFPLYKLIKKTIACIKRKQTSAERKRLVEKKPTKKDRQDMSGRDIEEIMEEDERDGRVIASIEKQEALYEGETVARENRIHRLEQEIDALNKSRKSE